MACVVPWGHGDIWDQALAEGHVWVHVWQSGSVLIFMA